MSSHNFNICPVTFINTPLQRFGDVLSSCRKGGFFVDLFVRVSNQVAVNMYKRLGYSVYRTVIEYYSASNGEPDEDAYGESAKIKQINHLDY